MKELKEMMKQYEVSDDIFNDEDLLVTKCKKALALQPVSDQIIMVLYSEAASIRKVAKTLNISASLAFKEIKRIQGNILESINNGGKQKC